MKSKPPSFPIELSALQRTLAARQELETLLDQCPRQPTDPRDVTALEDAFQAYLAALESLWAEVRNDLARFREVPPLLQPDLLARNGWQEIAGESQVDHLAALWQVWTTGVFPEVALDELSRLRENLLWLYRYAGFEAHYLGDQQTVAEFLRQGLVYAEDFLAAGETAAGVRARVLRLYGNAVINAYHLGNLQALISFYRQGQAHAETFLAAGETAAGVREEVLRLYYCAGFYAAERGDRAAAADYYRYRQGLAHAETFLAAGETATGVREQVLWLYVGAGVNSGERGERGDREAAAAYYRQGLEHAETFLAVGETAAGVLEEVLRLYVNAGVTAADRGDREAAADYYRQGLEHAETFLAAGETAAGVREHVLRLYYNAGVNAGERGDRAAAADYYRQGLTHAETFLAAGETAAGLREQVLDLFDDARINAFNINLLNLARHYQLLDQALRWTWGRSSIPQAVADYPGNRDLIALMPETQVLPLWRDALETWLLRCHGPALPRLRLAELDTFIRCAEALLLLDYAHNNDRFQSLFKQLLRHQASLEPQVADWRERQSGLAAQIHRELKRLPCHGELPEQPEAFIQATRQALAGLTRWQRWRHGWSAHRIHQRLTAYESGLANPPRTSQSLWRDIQRGQEELTTWLAGRLHDLLNLPAALDTSAEAVLGILLAGQTAEPATTVAQWLSHPPWDDAATLTVPLAATRWPDWVNRFAAEDKTHAALYAWTGKQQHHQRLVIARNLHHHPEPTLDQALRAFATGEAAPLQQLLTAAWAEAAPLARKLAWVLEAFAHAGTPDRHEIPDLTAVLGDKTLPLSATATPPSERYCAALAAVLLGDSQALLTTAIQAWLDRLLPLEPDAPLPRTLFRLKARFARALTTYPQPPDPVDLRERLHGWSRQALGLALAGPEPELDYLWDNLERARLVLTGLTLDPPSEKWTEETARQLRQELQTSLNPMPPPNMPWPPLQCWLERVRQIIPPLPDVETCRHRLQNHEALAQLFFDPNTGDLQALWLTPGQPLERRCFPAASRYAGWSTPDGDGVLACWIAWFQEGEHTLALQELWPTVMDSQPVRSVAATLSEWAHAAKVQRLCVLFPAELAQLPWEALEAFDPERLILERAVSLTHWRAPLKVSPEPQDPVPLATIVYAQRDGSVAYGRQESEQAGAYWRSPVPPPATDPEQSATVFDVMAQLQQRPHGHLIMHGRYIAHNPYISHLKLSSTDYLYAWTFGALDLQGHLGLSACQATLSGQEAEHLLGPVGLGPALIAAGARRVIGPLWNCEQLASWLFHRSLFQAAENRPERPWTCHLAQARRQLRAMTSAELRTFLQQHLGEKFREPDFDYLLTEERPFANPYYWAPFVVLGDDRP